MKISEIQFIDGATGSELERRGVDLSLPLWSTRALIDAPEILAEVHRDYLTAGSQAITTATFRTHRRSLEKVGMGGCTEELTRLALQIARDARDEVCPDALVLGSVAPLEDCYRPDLVPDTDICRREHAELIGNLMNAGADLILIETMNRLCEAQAAMQAAQQIAPGRWLISFCLVEDHPGELLSGESLASLEEPLSEAGAVGVNCVAAGSMQSQVRWLRDLLPSTPLLAYGNIGHADPHGNWLSTDAVCPGDYLTHARCWVEAGANIIGGCCGTTPDHIRLLTRELHQ